MDTAMPAKIYFSKESKILNPTLHAHKPNLLSVICQLKVLYVGFFINNIGSLNYAHLMYSSNLKFSIIV